MNEQNQTVQEELQDVSKKNPILKIILSIIAVLLLLIASFYGGIYYSSNIKDNEKQETKEEQKNEEDNKNQEESESKEELEENKNDETTKPRIVGTRYEEFDNIIKNLTEEKAIKSVPNYESFYLNRKHSTEPSLVSSGGGSPEWLYYDEDGTYIYQISDYDHGNDEVLRAGTWEIKEGKLILKEKYVLTIVDSTIDYIQTQGGGTGLGHKDYNLEIRKSSKVVEYEIEHIGISSIKEEILSEDATGPIKPDQYKLSRIGFGNKDMYSYEYNDDIEDFKYANMYYELIK